MTEPDVISHLIDVERLASDLLTEAQKEADRRKTDAKESAERLFLEGYGKIVSGLERKFSEDRKAIELSRDAARDEYAKALAATSLDQQNINAYLDSYFTEAK